MLNYNPKEESPRCNGCGSKYIWVKKWGLCVRCYREASKNNFIGYVSDKEKEKEVDHTKEILFIRNYFSGRNDWIYHPATFKIKMSDGTIVKYTPDFYDLSKNTFIEVSGTRQAFHQNKDKYTQLKKIYPEIKLEIYTSDGELVDNEKERQPVGTWQYNKK